MATMIRADSTIHQDILDEFLWDPEVEPTEIGVQVDDGVVTLTGTIDRYVTKLAAERAVQRIDGVRAVANDLSVRGPLTHNDTDIARVAAQVLETNDLLPRGGIEVSVNNGKIRLSGEVPWDYQRIAASNSLRYLAGVRDVINLIRVKQPPVSTTEVKAGIERALVRNAEVDADRINVQSSEGHVTLSGTVSSWPEKQEAGFAAWRARGVSAVTNNLRVLPS